MMKRYLVIILLLPLAAMSQLKLASIFSDNMVLQRNEPVHIWGTASPGEKVSISFGGENRSAIVSKDSSWSVYFKRQETNARAQSIFISCGREKIELKNILIGDVWIAAGQSNMEWPMVREMHWKEEVKQSDQLLIRINNPPPAGRYIYGIAFKDSLNRRLTKDSFYLWSQWNVCDSNTVKGMSAIAYYYAKSIVEKVKIPVGIINLSIGGAPVESFISREALQNSKQFSTKVKGDWLENKNLAEWTRIRGRQNVGNNPGGFKDELGLNHAYKPGFAYENGIAFLVGMPVKGFIWYQGESNSLETERVAEYKDLLHLLIEDYRLKWKQPDMPFYWVQLSSIDTTDYQSQLWPQFRDEQRQLLDEVKHGGMAVSSDIGSRKNVHPTNKKDVGERLARWALNKTYKKEIVPSGPLPVKAAYVDGEISISFRYGKGLTTSGNKPLRGFSLDGVADVEAMIRNDTIIIAAQEKPEFIYYAWKPFTDANLVNAQQLPASTFKLKVNGVLVPSLLPLPQKLQWSEGFFPLNECRSIFVKDRSIEKEGQWLQRELQKIGLRVLIENKAQKNIKKSIVLQLGKVESPLNKEEAFHLTVGNDQVLLTANTSHGIFNGIQTLLQLARDSTTIKSCNITDWPALITLWNPGKQHDKRRIGKKASRLSGGEKSRPSYPNPPSSLA